MSEDFVDRFEHRLVAAAHRQLAANSRAPVVLPTRAVARRRWKRGLLACAAVLLLAAPALAITQPWNPELGDSRRGHPTSSLSDVPATQADALAVLRRAQTPADRGTDTQTVLRLLNPDVSGIRLDDIRRLGTLPSGRAVILVPVEMWNLRDGKDLPPDAPAVFRLPHRDGLCVWALDSDGSGGVCRTLKQIRLGYGWGALGNELYGLVPDGVASVRAIYGDGTSDTIPVADNFYAAELTGPGLPQRFQLLSRDGAIITTTGYRNQKLP